MVQTGYLPTPRSVTAVVHYRNSKNGDDGCDTSESTLMLGDGGKFIYPGHYTSRLDCVSGLYWQATYGTPLKGTTQAEALNHSMAVIFGSMCKQFNLGQTSHSASWLFCEKMGDSYPAFESLITPGTAFYGDPQQESLSKVVTTNNNKKDFWILAGVSNHAFCLIARLLGGYSWERAGEIWFQSMERCKAASTIDFEGFARITIEIAASDVEKRLVNDAWIAVGVTP